MSFYRPQVNDSIVHIIAFCETKCLVLVRSKSLLRRERNNKGVVRLRDFKKFYWRKMDWTQSY